ncbi:AAA family ATPase [Pseudomonas neustonica]|uniref:AAA family ATPase n=1 Tax=Pseudomonas neustonica TaxID=2487346 RepID=UPI003F46B50A|tara:strand:- start:10035 stop:11021 length:987 start_codon:yes stop_codon:yes gene_type:complete
MKMSVQVPMTEFGFTAKASAPGFEQGHEHEQHVPGLNSSYHFRADLLKPFMNWLFAPCGDSSLLVGPTGSGKSSLVEQTAARLNWPCLTVSAHSRMEMPELTGFNMPVTDPVSGDLNTKFVDGPLTKAMRNGYLFVLDEYDTLDPAVSVGLHAVLEGRPLVIAENGGEVIRPHPNFRFIACGNTSGQGDESALYAQTMQQNLATMDRFRVFTVGYLEAAAEMPLLTAISKDIPEGVAENMVKIANSIRTRHLGNGADFLSVTMSTRTLLRWGRIASSYLAVGVKAPLQEALNEALLNRTDAVQRLAIEKIASSVLGSMWTVSKTSKAA